MSDRRAEGPSLCFDNDLIERPRIKCFRVAFFLSAVKRANKSWCSTQLATQMAPCNFAKRKRRNKNEGSTQKPTLLGVWGRQNWFDRLSHLPDRRAAAAAGGHLDVARMIDNRNKIPIRLSRNVSVKEFCSKWKKATFSPCYRADADDNVQLRPFWRKMGQDFFILLWRLFRRISCGW